MIDRRKVLQHARLELVQALVEGQPVDRHTLTIQADRDFYDAWPWRRTEPAGRGAEIARKVKPKTRKQKKKFRALGGRP